MKKKNILALISLLMVCLLLVSCGAKKAESEYYYVSDDSMHDSDYYAESPNKPGGFSNEAKDSYNEPDYPTMPSPADLSNLKLTYTADINVETLEFDKSLAAILDAVNASGGFIRDRKSVV